METVGLVAMDAAFWAGRRVFLTGHTGFKGAWLTMLLQRLGAEVTGYSLLPPTQPSLFESAALGHTMTSIIGDIRDYERIASALQQSRASVVFHLAAQSIVAQGYHAPRDTFSTNLTGTINLLDAVRDSSTVQAIVVVTSDKCYVPAANGSALIEGDPLGGRDPYSASKGCAEIATNSWRESFFSGPQCARIATARAGNVIGGGDWSAHRLLPDIANAFLSRQTLKLRMPDAVRPWQHVLDALCGYVQLTQALLGENGCDYARAWNFGPAEGDHFTVRELANRCAAIWGDDAQIEIAATNFQQETLNLRLDASAAEHHLHWHPRWTADMALRATLEWYRAWHANSADAQKIHDLCVSQIESYLSPEEITPT